MAIEFIFNHKRFSPLLWTQFFGALNDNFLKNAMIIMMTYKGVTLWGLDTGSLVAFASGIFILPFLLFSALAGQISDKFEKSRLIVFIKWLEVIIMLIASVGFYFHHFSLLMAALFLMGLHSTLFGPIKYSIIPDLVTEKQLTAGNAYVEIGTFLAILIGTIIGGLSNNEIAISLGLLCVAILGLISAYFVPQVAPADPDHVMNYNPIAQLAKATHFARPHATVFYSVIGISWFWFFGAGILSLLPVLTKDLLHASQEVVTLFLATFTIGIALGAFICTKISKHKVELGLVAIGALGMSVFLCDFAWALSSLASLTRLSIDLLLVSIFGGLFTVPLYTLMQERTDRRVRSRIIAANNIFNALFMIVSSVMLMALYAIHATIPQIIIVYSMLNLLNITIMCLSAPEYKHEILSFFSRRK